MQPYDAPDVIELGDARQLTQGNGGTVDDNCNCCLRPVDPDA